MSYSIHNADLSTHVKTIATALAAVVAVIRIGIAARVLPTPGMPSAPVLQGAPVLASIEISRL